MHVDHLLSRIYFKIAVCHGWTWGCNYIPARDDDNLRRRKKREKLWCKIHWIFRSFYLFVYFWLLWVLVVLHRLSLVLAGGVAVHGLLVVLASLRSTGSRARGPQDLWHAGSVVWARGLGGCVLGAPAPGSGLVAHRLHCSVACGIFLDQGSNLCPLVHCATREIFHWIL